MCNAPQIWCTPGYYCDVLDRCNGLYRHCESLAARGARCSTVSTAYVLTCDYEVRSVEVDRRMMQVPGVGSILCNMIKSIQQRANDETINAQHVITIPLPPKDHLPPEIEVLGLRASSSTPPTQG
jgi:hypothetical protein